MSHIPDDQRCIWVTPMEGRCILPAGHEPVPHKYEFASRPGFPTAEARDLHQKVTSWWANNAKAEADKLAPKAAEYGSYDLELIGKVLRDMINSDHQVNDKLSNIELGIAFYELGKIARLVSGIFDGQVPSDDNWQDTAIYPRMVMYVREHGSWP